jgi:hypothetical protein
MCSAIKNVLILLLCFCSLSAFAADAIKGKVRNQTTNQPSAGDEVVLLRLGEGMEEAARARTDEQGNFNLPATVAGAQHIVRVIHQGVNYDQKVTQTGPLEIAVFNAFPRIPEISGSMGIVQIEADGDYLKITEMYSITNASQPPLTQAGPRNFTFSLPQKAGLDSFEAKRAGSIWMNAAPVAIAGQPGRYAVDFPLRPGDTLFKYSYHLPYAGAATLRLKLAYPIKSFAVGHPPSMSFKPLRAQAFKKIGLAQGLELEAASQPLTKDVPAFEISGMGTAPRPADVKAPPAAPPVPAADPTALAAAQPVPNGVPGQSSHEVWAVGAAFAAIFAAGIFALRRRPRIARPGPVASAGREPLLEALQEELSHLENERRNGAISAGQYDATKQALDLSRQRALARKG